MTINRRVFIHGAGALAGWLARRTSPSSPTDATASRTTTTSALPVRLQDRKVANVLAFGAKADGVANDTDAINRAMATESCIYFPTGTYLCAPSQTASDFLFPIGNRSGIEFFGDGPQSILKLSNDVPANLSMFGSGNGQTVSRMRWRDLSVDLNGLNNLQSTFLAKHRLNAFIYLFSAGPRDIAIERVRVLNGSGSQIIRVGNDSTDVGSRITIRDCDFDGFGIGIPGNRQQDVSVLYLSGHDVTIQNCRFRNAPFTMDLSRGHTAIELHSGHGHRVVDCGFEEVQAPILSVADRGDVIAGEVRGCTILNCAYAINFDSGGDGHTNGFRISQNQFISNKPVSAGMIYVGSSAERLRSRMNLEISDNHFEVATSVQGRACLMLVSSQWTSLRFANNRVRNLTAQAIHFEGSVRDSGHASLIITGNHFDSCGSVIEGSPFFPGDGSPVQIMISPATEDPFSAIVVENNLFSNSTSKNYSRLGHVYLGSQLRSKLISVRMNSQPDDAVGLVHDAGCIATAAKDVTSFNLGAK